MSGWGELGSRVNCGICPIVGICSTGNLPVCERYWGMVSILRGFNWVNVNMPIFDEHPLNSLFGDGERRLQFMNDREVVSSITARCPLRPQIVPDIRAQVYRLEGGVNRLDGVVTALDAKITLQQVHVPLWYKLESSIWNRIKKLVKELRK